jgi:hypothetical protein
MQISQASSSMKQGIEKKRSWRVEKGQGEKI